MKARRVVGENARDDALIAGEHVGRTAVAIGAET